MVCLFRVLWRDYIAMNNITYMYDDFSIPVSDWNYQGSVAGDNLNL